MKIFLFKWRFGTRLKSEKKAFETKLNPIKEFIWNRSEVKIEIKIQVSYYPFEINLIKDILVKDYKDIRLLRLSNIYNFYLRIKYLFYLVYRVRIIT